MDVAHTHEGRLSHHVKQAASWLDGSEGGKRTAFLSYAALELRFAIERLAVHYWKSLLNRPLTADDVERIGTYKSLERRLYDLGGHQKQIDGHFAFMRATLRLMQIPAKLPTPNLGRLSEHWHACSEICHITWPLGSRSELYRDAVFEKLNEVRQTLLPLVEDELSGWPVIHDVEFAALRDRFVSGSASESDLEEWAKRKGLWARVEDRGGKPVQFLGVAVQPSGGAKGGAGAA